MGLATGGDSQIKVWALMQKSKFLIPPGHGLPLTPFLPTLPPWSYLVLTGVPDALNLDSVLLHSLSWLSTHRASSIGSLLLWVASEKVPWLLTQLPFAFSTRSTQDHLDPFCAYTGT